VSDVSDIGTLGQEASGAPNASEASEATPRSKWNQLRRKCAPLVRYLLDSEVHTYAFSVAANAIISFIPFVVLLYTLALSVFHSHAMAGVVNDLVLNFFPSTANPRFWGILEGVAPPHVQLLSLVMILISCTGIFLPLEVALNQAWGVTKSRNYIMNQLVAFGLAILMVVLGMISVVLNAWQRQLLTALFFHHVDNFVFKGISYLWLALSSGAACVLFLFAIYWLLPNRKVPWRPVLRTSIITGTIWLAAKYIFVIVLPYMDLKAIYGPFYVSVGLLFWAYGSGLILFAGAQFSARTLGDGEK
jgi:membrane protein